MAADAHNRSNSEMPHWEGFLTTHLTRERARQLAIMGQWLDAPAPVDAVDVVRRLGRVQLDPTSAVARSEYLVMWSRLGDAFRTEEWRRLLYKERRLFEYQAHVFPMEDYGLHRARMSSWPSGDSAWPNRVREWLEVNAPFREYILREITIRGRLQSRDLQDRAVQPWRSTGWTNQRNVNQMLEFIAARGEIAIADREGSERVWDLVERALPTDVEIVPPTEASRILGKRRLRALGILPEHLPEVGCPVEIDGLPGTWTADPETLGQSFAGRTAALSPFDQLVYDRDRTRTLFEMDYRLEIYVPQGKRRWGCYVLPVLSGDRFVAKVDAKVDRGASVLRVPALHMESHAGKDDLQAVHGELNSLARWLGVGGVDVLQVFWAE